MLDALHKSFIEAKDRFQKGAVSVEYVVVITFLIGLSLIVIILLVNPTGAVDDSILPRGYNSVSQKIGQFGTLPE